MRLDEVTAEIRPRSDWEAVDLGFALVRRDFWRCLCVWWLAVVAPTAIAGYFLWNHPLWLLALFWWWKPAGSRMVLFELSRRLFGERPPWRSVWREIPRAWQRRFFHRFLWARFSPWLPVTLAVEDLEGLRGKSYKQRAGQLGRRSEGVVMWIYFISDLVAAWLGLALFGLVMMFVPEGLDGALSLAFDSWDPDEPLEVPLLILRIVICCAMLAISLTDIFMVGAGFGIYINNRTWIEGWDVELAFKRMAQRLTNALILLGALLVCATPNHGRADEIRKPVEVIREVQAHPDFKIHSVKEWELKKNKKTSPPLSWLSGFGQAVAYFFGICAVVVLLGFGGWVLWKYRHAFFLRGAGAKLQIRAPTARVVMGMEVSSTSLPADVPTAAWALWEQARYHEALALLYRGSISRVIEIANVDIHESDTEGDCMRRVESAGTAARSDYFRSITGAWIRLAYAGACPTDEEVHQLCRQWPFGEGGAR